MDKQGKKENKLIRAYYTWHSFPRDVKRSLRGFAFQVLLTIFLIIWIPELWAFEIFCIWVLPEIWNKLKHIPAVTIKETRKKRK